MLKKENVDRIEAALKVYAEENYDEEGLVRPESYDYEVERPDGEDVIDEKRYEEALAKYEAERQSRIDYYWYAIAEAGNNEYYPEDLIPEDADEELEDEIVSYYLQALNTMDPWQAYQHTKEWIEEPDVFYAVQYEDHYDWDDGSLDLEEAIAIADKYCEDPDIKTEEVQIARITGCSDKNYNPYCAGVCEYGRRYYPRYVPTSEEDFPNHH